MMRPFVLTIAGFDPSGGAGVLADCKTMEANKVMGLGIVSAITYQHESKFSGLSWTPLESVKQQLEILSEKYKYTYVKIGIMENLEVIKTIVEDLHAYNPDIKIIWDPILKASAGYTFHEAPSIELFTSICKGIFLITPNWQEMQWLYPHIGPMEAAKDLAKHCIVFLKGGHQMLQIGKDYLFQGENQMAFNPRAISAYDKHGTGCIFSSALASNLARGFSLKKSALKAKKYVTYVLLSNKTLLGYHK